MPDRMSGDRQPTIHSRPVGCLCKVMQKSVARFCDLVNFNSGCFENNYYNLQNYMLYRECPELGRQ